LEGRKRARLAFENTVTLEWNGCGKHLYSESEVKTLLEWGHWFKQGRWTVAWTSMRGERACISFGARLASVTSPFHQAHHSTPRTTIRVTRTSHFVLTHTCLNWGYGSDKTLWTPTRVEKWPLIGSWHLGM
jgi:hypothetical protein